MPFAIFAKHICLNLFPFFRTIFVMEDVDAASTVVHSRSEGVEDSSNTDVTRKQKFRLRKKMLEAKMKREKVEKTKESEIQTDVRTG